MLPSCILLSTRHSRAETRLIEEPVVDREISIVTRAGKSLSPAAAVGQELLQVQVTQERGKLDNPDSVPLAASIAEN